MKLNYKDYLKSKKDVYYVELFLTDEDKKFIDGIFYLEIHPKILPMAAIICDEPGKYEGAVLIGVDEEVLMFELDGAMIKYQIRPENTILLLKDNRFPNDIRVNALNLLVHNESYNKELTIICEDWDKEVVILPGHSKRFIPWLDEDTGDK